MRNKRNIKYSYMAGSRQQHLTCSFMRACLRCLTLGDTNVLQYVCTCCCYYGVVAVLRMVVELLLLLSLCTKKLKKRKQIRTSRENENTEVSKEKVKRSSKY